MSTGEQPSLEELSAEFPGWYFDTGTSGPAYAWKLADPGVELHAKDAAELRAKVLGYLTDHPSPPPP